MMYAEYKMQDQCKKQSQTQNSKTFRLRKRYRKATMKVRTNRHDTETKKNLQKMDRNDPEPEHYPVDDACISIRNQFAKYIA